MNIVWLPRRGAGGEVAGEGEEEDPAGDHRDEDGEEEHRQPQRGHAQQPRGRVLGVGCMIFVFLVVYVSTSKVQSNSISQSLTPTTNCLHITYNLSEYLQPLSREKTFFVLCCVCRTMVSCICYFKLNREPASMFTFVLLLVLILLHLRLLPGALLQVLVLAGGERELDGRHGDHC